MLATGDLEHAHFAPESSEVPESRRSASESLCSGSLRVADGLHVNIIVIGKYHKVRLDLCSSIPAASFCAAQYPQLHFCAAKYFRFNCSVPPIACPYIIRGCSLLLHWCLGKRGRCDVDSESPTSSDMGLRCCREVLLHLMALDWVRNRNPSSFFPPPLKSFLPCCKLTCCCFLSWPGLCSEPYSLQNLISLPHARLVLLVLKGSEEIACSKGIAWWYP